MEPELLRRMNEEAKFSLYKFNECCSETYHYNLAKTNGIDWVDCGEQTLVSLELARFKLNKCKEIQNLRELDTIVKELSLSLGRADIAIFHVDGTISVIEAKDGSKGYSHVVKGIGQVTLYASQLAVRKLDIKKINRYLLWSSVGDQDANEAIQNSCELAGVVPMLREPIKESIARGMLANKYGSEYIQKLDGARTEYINSYTKFINELAEFVDSVK